MLGPDGWGRIDVSCQFRTDDGAIVYTRHHASFGDRQVSPVSRLAPEYAREAPHEAPLPPIDGLRHLEIQSILTNLRLITQTLRPECWRSGESRPVVQNKVSRTRSGRYPVGPSWASSPSMSTSIDPKKLMFSLCAGEMWASTSSSTRRPAVRIESTARP